MVCVTCQTTQRPLMRDLYICDECTLISSRYKSDPFLYDKYYYDRYLKYKNDEIGRALRFLRTKLVYSHVAAGNLLDFGCATGEFHASLNSGIKGYGFDINKHFGFNKVESVDIKILTMWDVIEHLDNPTYIVKECDATHVFISTPSTDDYEDEDFGNWRHYRPHEHVHYFNERSLKKFLNKLGYDVMEINYEESKVRKSGGDRNILTMVGVKNG